MSRLPLRVAAAGVAALVVLPLAGCTTTQERSANLAKNAEKAAEAKRFQVGRTNPDVKVVSVTTIPGDSANAVVVKLENRSSTTQVVVPVALDLYDAKDTSIYTNRVDGLDQALNNIEVVPPGTSWWLNNQVPTTKAARTRVRVGTSRTATPASIPEMRVSPLKFTEDGGVKVGRGKIENLSTIEQRRLTIFAVALKGGKPVAAGRAVIEKLGPKGGKKVGFSIYFNGDPTGAQLEISAPPSILGGA